MIGLSFRTGFLPFFKDSIDKSNMLCIFVNTTLDCLFIVVVRFDQLMLKLVFLLYYDSDQFAVV